MKLSKKSWHYWLLRKTGYYDSHFVQVNLCWYFWQVMATLFIKMPVIFVIAVLTVVLAPIWLPLFGLICLGVWVYSKWEDRQLQLKIAAGMHPWDSWPKKPSLFRAWLKAKKDKVCPVIEWTD